jgi:tight adherence protein B
MTPSTGEAAMDCLGAGLATVVGFYVRRPDDWLVLRLRLGGTALRRGGPQPVLLRRCVAVAATAAATMAVPNPWTQMALLAIVAAAFVATTLRRQAKARQRAVEFRGDIARVLSSVAAELRAGAEPLVSLQAAVTHESADWEPVRTAALGDVVEALRAMSSLPGGESLAEVAAAWHLAEQTGSPLASALDRMATAVRAEVELDRDVAVEAAPARATGRLMAILPLAGLGLGLLLGANPLRVLFSSGIGVVCLMAGLLLAGLGVWRIERIVAEVEGR